MEHAVREFGRDDFDQEVWEWLAEATHYVAVDFADRSQDDKLMQRMNELDAERGTRGNRVYYFAVPPQAMPHGRQGARRAPHEPKAGRA